MDGIPASELAAWSELAEVIGEQYAGRGPANLANALPRLLSAYSQSQARVAELEKAIERHRESVLGFMEPLDIDAMPDGARWVVRTLSGKSKALWSVLPQSEGAT